MKKLRKMAFLLIFFTSLYTSCRKSGYTYCTFDKKLLTWKPQESGDYLKYYNNYNDSLTFKVEEKYIPPNDSFPNNCDCVCEPLVAKFSATDINSGQTIYTEISNNNNFAELKIKIFNQDNNFSCKLSDETIHLDSFLINDRYLKDVIILEHDSVISTNRNFLKIIIAKNYGIVQMFEKNSTVWTLKDI